MEDEKELCHLDTIAFYPSPVGNSNDKFAAWNRPGDYVVAMAGCGLGSSRRAFARNCDGITAGISVTSDRNASPANSDPGPSAADSDTNSDAGPTDIRAPNAGTRAHDSGATPASPDAGTTYSANTSAFCCADYAPDADDATSPNFHPTAPSLDADPAASLWIQPTDRQLGQVLGYNRGDTCLPLAVLRSRSPTASAGGAAFPGDQRTTPAHQGTGAVARTDG